MVDSDHQSTQPGALIGSNDDLLIEILRLLHVVSIIRFKSVSKHWRWLLSSRHSSLLYDNGLVSPGLFSRDLYIPYDDENQSTSPFRSMAFYPDHRGIKIVQSCNGLLLCCSNQRHQSSHDYYVINPTTKQVAIIPSVPGDQDVVKGIRFMGLLFHETDCANYKVICIQRQRLYEQRLQIQIYSSDTRIWKKTLDESVFAEYYTPFSGGVYWNGAIHWAPSCWNPVYFKVDVDRLQALLLPSPLPARVESFNGYRDGARPLYFGESGGHLHLVDTADHENHLHLNVYEMLSDHSGWFVKYRVELDDLRVTYPEMIHTHQQPRRPNYYEFEVLDVVRGEEEKDKFMVVRIPNKIIRYNVTDKSFKLILDFTVFTNTCSDRIGYARLHGYIKTLTSF